MMRCAHARARNGPSVKMALIRAVFQRFLQNQRKMHEEHDVWKLYHLLYYYDQSGGKEVQVTRPPDVSYHEQLHRVHSIVTKQLISRLKVLSSSPTNLPHSTNTTGHTAANSSNAIYLERCQPGGIISGVHLRGHIVAGTVLCFFPGTVYLPTDLKAMPNFPDIGKDNPYLMSCSDGSIIDAMSYVANEGAGTDVHRGVLSEGHMIRHPQPDQEANVMPFSYNVDRSFPKDLLPLIPNTYYKPPGLLYYSRSVLKTIVFVATRHICDEELLLNYRLHPDSDLPPWYSPQDTDEARERWNY